MKLVKTASGKQTIKISKKEWTSIGKKAGWDDLRDSIEDRGGYTGDDNFRKLEAAARSTDTITITSPRIHGTFTKFKIHSEPSEYRAFGIKLEQGMIYVSEDSVKDWNVNDNGVTINLM